MAEFIRMMVRACLPKDARPRKLPFGLAKGRVATIDFNLDAAFYFGRHEPDLFAHYRRLLKLGMNCFDIGMYRGWDALNLSHLTGGKTISFDGNPQCIEMTREFLAPSGADVTLVNAYLSDGTDGTLSLNQAATKYGMPHFVKMDVEGAEASILNGANDILTKRIPLIIETHGESVENACVQTLRRFGYSITVATRSTLFSEARSLEHNRWLVCS
jgi:hypothetical protein